MNPASGGDPARRDELAANLQAVRARIARACASAGRDPAEITLVVVTKHFPAADVRLLAGLGVADFGENRDQEAGPKYAEVRAGRPGPPRLAGLSGLPELPELPELRLHFIGQLQSNKAASVAAYADVVHTVDRPKLVVALDRGAERAGRVLEALVQVSLDRTAEAGPSDAGAPTHRGGVRPDDVIELAASVAACARLRLAGLMAVAPIDEDPDRAFARLADTSALLRARFPQARWISAGMSGDLEAAVRHGATHLRVGTAILGSRPPLR